MVRELPLDQDQEVCEMSTIVVMRHIRKAKFCSGATRHWFAERGWDWSDFLTNGRPAEDFEATGCPLARTVATIAREEALRG